ncbi:MAG TPA: hypothetical protein GXX75_04180 [Clostridiales bacterium]|nr:hypothetical protein [Clostridiales bacterium]
MKIGICDDEPIVVRILAGLVGQSYLPTGTGIYMYGADSGLQYGTIDSYNVTSSSGSVTFTDLVKATYSSQTGDSGSPIVLYDGNHGGVSKVTLIGTHRGTESDGKKTFSKYLNISNQLGITALTS